MGYFDGAASGVAILELGVVDGMELVEVAGGLLVFLVVFTVLNNVVTPVVLIHNLAAFPVFFSEFDLFISIVYDGKALPIESEGAEVVFAG